MDSFILLLIGVGVAVYFAFQFPWIIALVCLTVIVLIMWSIAEVYKRNTPLRNIKTARILNKTQWKKDTYQPSGFSYGKGGSRFYWRVQKVPSHVEIRFLVTFTDNTQQEISVVEGTPRCDSILAHVDVPLKKDDMLLHPVPTYLIEKSNSRPEKHFPPELKKNQLGANVYIIGKDIPPGIYDFLWVWGDGSILVSKDETTLLGASKFFKWVGNRYDYEQRQCMNVVCDTGNYLHVQGNLIVEIRKSKPVEIDL